jgi:hypothetical protein
MNRSSGARLSPRFAYPESSQGDHKHLDEVEAPYIFISTRRSRLRIQSGRQQPTLPHRLISKLSTVKPCICASGKNDPCNAHPKFGWPNRACRRRLAISELMSLAIMTAG